MGRLGFGFGNEGPKQTLSSRPVLPRTTTVGGGWGLTMLAHALTAGCGCRERTTFSLPANGRCASGILSQVPDPITTAFLQAFTRVARDVCSKNAKSVGMRQGRSPFRPMPPEQEAATMAATGALPSGRTTRGRCLRAGTKAAAARATIACAWREERGISGT